jgi:two-component system, OmpR family, response regulator
MPDLRRTPLTDKPPQPGGIAARVHGYAGSSTTSSPATTGRGGSGFAEAKQQPISGGQFQTFSARRLAILVIEDDAQMRLLLRGCFEHAGFSVTEAANADDLWAAMAAQRFDLVTLDVRLPGAGGLELVQAIRERSDVPVVMISVITNLIDRVTALERGADDFIVKPFDLMDLLARVRAVVRRYEGRSTVPVPHVTRRKYRFDGWLFDAGRRELRSSSGDIKNLTDQELLLLELFVQHPQQELTREAIIGHLHGQGDPGEADASPGESQSSRLRVDMQVSRLRKKLETADSSVSVIKSVRGVGYVFAATVETALA